MSDKTQLNTSLDLLLVTIPGNTENTTGILKRFISPVEPLGILYVAANVKRHGFSVAILDSFAQGLGLEDVMNEIGRQCPRIIGFSILTCQADLYCTLAQKIRKKFPDILIVLGNIHASVYSDYFLKNNLADAVVHGEGEECMANIMKAYKNGCDMGGVDGISFRRRNQIINTAPAVPIHDLNVLPAPAWDLINMDLYHLRFYMHPRAGNSKIFAQYMTSRGCRGRCKFCSVNDDGKIKYFSVERALEDVGTLYSKYGSRFIVFDDPNFMTDHARVVKICDGLSRFGGKLLWGCSGRIDNIIDNPEILALMKKSGCEYISYGIESGNQSVLDSCGKGIKLCDVREVIRLTNKAGIAPHGLFILGLPGETTATCRETINFACRLDLDIAQFAIFTPFPGSEYYNELISAGKIDSYDWSKYTQYPSFKKNTLPIYAPDTMTPEELLCLQKEALRHFYLRPKIALMFLKKIRYYNLMDYFLSAYFLLKNK